MDRLRGAGSVEQRGHRPPPRPTGVKQWYALNLSKVDCRQRRIALRLFMVQRLYAADTK